MKLTKILSGLFMLMILMAPLVSAVDIAPIISLDSDYDRTTTTAVFTATAVDVLDNAGVAWIKLYENNVLIAEKNCNQGTSCTLIKPVVKTFPGGTFTYRADAYDRGGHLSSSDNVIISFAGVDEEKPEYSNIQSTPASPAEYGTHDFSVTWTDNGRIGSVFIEHDFFGSTYTAEVTEHDGDVYTYTLDDYIWNIEIGQHQWRMYAYDVAEQGSNTETTPMQSYEITKADADFIWTVTPSETVDYGTETSVECALTNDRNTESEVELFRNGEEISNPDAETLLPGTYTYTCNASATSHFNANSETKIITVNKLPADIILMLNGQSQNITVERLDESVVMRGEVVTGEDFVRIFFDGNEVANGSTPLSHLERSFNETGTHEVKLVMPETAIYAEASETWHFEVVDTRAPNEVIGLQAENITENSAILTWSNPDNDDFAGVQVFVDNVNVANVTGVESYTITELTYDTNYEVELFSFDTYGNVATDSAREQFTTLPDTDGPQWDNIGLEVGDWFYGSDDVISTSVPVLVPVGSTKLASEIFDITAMNAIVVGNPCNNPITAQLMGNPANCSEAIEAGTAIIRVYENGGHTQIVVAGHNALLTRMAARVLADYDNLALSGKNIVVTGTSLSDVQITVETDTGDANDFSEYPNFLITENSGVYTFNGVFVVGDSAPGSDSVAVIDIATSLRHTSAPIIVSTTASKLASEVFDITVENAIIVGNPCYNPITAQLMGNPTDCVNAIPAGKAIIKVYESNGYSQIVVAGHLELDTRRAARVLANFEDYNLVGKEVEVTGTSLTDISVTMLEADTGDANDLSEYPKNFITQFEGNNYFNGYFIVGDAAPSSDVVAMTDIATAMQYANINAGNKNPSIRWTDNIAINSAWFEHDFTGTMINQSADGNNSDVYYLNMTDLPAGTYQWRGHADDTSNNEGSTDWFNFTIHKAGSLLNLELDGTSSDITVFENSDLNITAELVAGEGDINVSTIAGSTTTNEYLGAGPFSDVRSVGSGAQTFDVVLSYAETQNYTASSTTYTVNVVEIVRNVSLTVIPIEANVAQNMNATFTVRIDNTGNVDDTYSLSITDDAGADVAVLSSTSETVLAGSWALLTLEVADNTTGQYNVTVQAVSDTDSNINDSVVAITNVVDLSEVINSTVNGTYYASGNYSNTEIPQLLASSILDSTVDVDSYIEVSDVQRSTVTNSTIDSNSQINDSTVSNSDLTACVVLNSTLDEITASNCRIEDSYADPSDLTGSTVTGDSNIIDSNVTYSIVDNSDITNSDVNNTNVTDSTIVDSEVDDSTLDEADLYECDVDDSVVTNSDLDYCNVIDSTITDAVVDNSNVTNSTVINSTLPEGTDVVDAHIEDGVIVNGTVDGTDYTGNSTNLTDAVNYNPVASFTTSAITITEGDSVTFTSTSTDANIPGALNDSLTYNWTIAGTSFSTVSNPSHTFSTDGTYTVQLEVKDSFGKTDTESVVITVNNKNTGGSSGGSRRSTDSRVISLDFVRGTMISLEVFQGDIIQFTFEGAQHTLIVKDVTINDVTLRIESNPIEFTLAKYTKKNINLDGDMYNDFSVKVNHIIGNTGASLTFDIKELVEYEPIFIPTPQPIAPVDDNITEDVNQTIEDNATINSETELSAWQKVVSWVKGLFSSEDTDADNETVPVTGAVTTDVDSEDDDEAKEPFVAPKALVGSLLVVLILGLGLGGYFIARKKVMEKRIEKYLM